MSGRRGGLTVSARDIRIRIARIPDPGPARRTAPFAPASGLSPDAEIAGMWGYAHRIGNRDQASRLLIALPRPRHCCLGLLGVRERNVFRALKASSCVALRQQRVSDSTRDGEAAKDEASSTPVTEFTSGIHTRM